MDIRPALVADAKPPEAGKPGQRTLHDPPVAAQPLARVDAASRYPRLDAAPAEEPAAAWKVVTLIRVELVGSPPGPSLRTLDGFDPIHKFLEDLGIVDLGAAERYGERHAAPIDDDVALGAGPAAVYRVGAGLLSPLSVKDPRVKRGMRFVLLHLTLRRRIAFVSERRLRVES